MKFKCPCCGYKTLDRERAWDICPVCFWEDDAIQYDKPEYSGGANRISLIEARENYKKIGCVKEEFKQFVREPLDCEKNEADTFCEEQYLFKSLDSASYPKVDWNELMEDVKKIQETPTSCEATINYRIDFFKKQTWYEACADISAGFETGRCSVQELKANIKYICKVLLRALEENDRGLIYKIYALMKKAGLQTDIENEADLAELCKRYPLDSMDMSACDFYDSLIEFSNKSIDYEVYGHKHPELGKLKQEILDACRKQPELVIVTGAYPGYSYLPHLTKELGYKVLKDRIEVLLEWMQDVNWPGAQVIFDFLLTMPKEELKRHMHTVLWKAYEEKDDPWIQGLIVLMQSAGIAEYFENNEEYTPIFEFVRQFE